MSDTFEIAEIEASVETPPGVAKILKPALLKDWLSYFASKIVPGFMGLISVPVFIRLIGLDEYGRFAVIVPLLMAVAGASSGWLAQGILRFHPVAGDPGSRQAVFDRAVDLGTVASVLITALLLTLTLAGLHYRLSTSLVSLAFCLSLLVYTVALSRFQAKLQPMSVLRREIVRSTAGFFIPVLLVVITGRKHFELIILGQAIAYTIALLPIFGSRSQTKEECFSLYERPSTGLFYRRHDSPTMAVRLGGGTVAASLARVTGNRSLDDPKGCRFQQRRHLCISLRDCDPIVFIPGLSSYAGCAPSNHARLE